MILHIVPDNKFIDMAYNMFEKASPNNNKFMVVTRQKEFKYIKTTPITKVVRDKFLSNEFAQSLNNYEFIVLHTLSDMAKKLILNANETTKFIWIGWGFDYYCYSDKELLKEKTLQLKNNLIKSKDFFGKNILRKIKKFAKYASVYKGIEDTEKIFNKIDYFAPVLYEDYLLIQKQFKNFNPLYLDWNYGTLENDLIHEDLIISADNILLGNSASFENNHIEAIDMLKKLDLNKKKIICPLSYGLREYADSVIKYGNKNFGMKFNPLLDFMKIEEYNKVISSCSIVVMNHFRQQAMGNIIVMMYFGAKIFLNKENIIYDFLKNNDAIIFSMEELTSKSINIRLSEEEIDKNREIIRNYWGIDIMRTKTKELILTMNKG